MVERIVIPVAVGFAVGIGFVVVFALLMSNFPILRVESTSSSGQVSVVVIKEGASMENSSYEPQVVRVVIGLNDTVRWINKDLAPQWIEADNYADPDFFSNTLTRNLILPGESFEYTFTKTGEFGYHGRPWQRGTVIVLPADELLQSFK